MSDKGHELTDEMIEELEKRLEREYSRAYKDLARKTKAYFDKFKADDAAMKAQVDAGEVTREYWLQWRYNHMMTGKRWIEMRDTLAEDLMKIDSKARSIINEHTPEAYALNHNYATFQVEKDSMLNTSYTLYNREAVENILKDDPKLLPYPRTESNTAKELRERADLIWNRQKLNNEITQGILQGEPIKDIAKRLQNVVGMDGRAALRNARTMMTAAENKGREDAYDALEEKGVDLDRKWVATLDDKTRHSHRLLHGEIKDRKTGLYSNGLKYPADPDGDPAEVYNCRCSEIATVTGFPIDIPKWSPKMGDMTYEEWLGEHENQPKEEEKWNAVEFMKANKMEFSDLKDFMPYENYSELYNDLRDKSLPLAESAGEYFKKVVDGTYQNDEILSKLNSITNEKMLSDRGYAILNRLENSSIVSNPLVALDAPKSIEQFIADVGGGDLTSGSCASLSFCFAANSAGYEIHDFRGGDSMKFFSSGNNIHLIAQMKNVISNSERSKTPIKTTVSMLKEMPMNEPHILGVGRHAAIVEHTDDGYRFLELQAPQGNGWYQLTTQSLARRFGATKTSKYGDQIDLINVDSLKNNEYFSRILTYINTDEGSQKKGEYGSRK